MDGIDRRAAWLLLVSAGAALVVVAAVLVPWDWTPGLTLRAPSAHQVFSAEELRRAESHAAALRWLTWSSYGVSLLLAVVLGLTPLGARLVRRVTGRVRWWLAVPLATFALLLLGRLVTLPLDLLVRQRNLRNGLTTQGPAGWWSDWALSLLVSWVMLTALFLLVVGLARRSPRWWFAWAGAILVVLTFLVSMVYPLVVEPLFNDFRSLPDGPLREQVLELAKDEGVAVGDVLVSDASRRTTTLNAYVSGIGGTRRIVLYDNLVHDVDREQVLAVVAHELAHARHHDVVLGTGLGALGVVVGVAALALLLDSPRVRRRAGVSGPADPAAVALVAALVALGGFVSSPAQNVVSRAIEARADLTGLEATHDPEAFRQVQRQLAVHSLADPTPPWFGYVWFASHPTVLQRLGIADAVERAGR